MGVVGEDVEDDRGAVDHRDVERRLQVALLARQQLVVAGDEVGAGPLDLRLQLVELAAPEVAVPVGSVADLDHLARGRDAGRPQQLLELGELILALRGGTGDDPDRQRPLARPGVLDAGTVLHQIKCRCARGVPGAVTLRKMSEANVEIVRRSIAAFNAGGFEAAFAFAHPEVVFEEPPSQPGSKTAHGPTRASRPFPPSTRPGRSTVPRSRSSGTWRGRCPGRHRRASART